MYKYVVVIDLQCSLLACLAPNFRCHRSVPDTLVASRRAVQIGL